MSRELILDDRMCRTLIDQIPWVLDSFPEPAASRIIQILQDAAASRVISYDDAYELLSLSGYKYQHKDTVDEWGEETLENHHPSEDEEERIHAALVHQRICRELSKQLFLQSAVYNRQLVKHENEKGLGIFR